MKPFKFFVQKSGLGSKHGTMYHNGQHQNDGGKVCKYVWGKCIGLNLANRGWRVEGSREKTIIYTREGA